MIYSDKTPPLTDVKIRSTVSKKCVVPPMLLLVHVRVRVLSRTASNNGVEVRSLNGDVYFLE